MLAMIGAVSLPDCKLGGEVHSAPLLHLVGQTASRLRGRRSYAAKEDRGCAGGGAPLRLRVQANDHTELHMQATRSGSEEDDSPQRAAHAPDRRGWSQEDVATLKKGMQVHGHHWSKIQVGLLLSSCTARCMATSGGGRAAGQELSSRPT